MLRQAVLLSLGLAVFAMQGCAGRSLSSAANAGGGAGATTTAVAGVGGQTAGMGDQVAGMGGDSFFQFDGSCSATDGTCADHHYEGPEESAYQEYLCTMNGSAWDSVKHCPKTNRIGGCSFIYGVPIIVTWYYDADAASAAKAACVGTWILD
jgi:hypothetical protein